MSDCGNCDGCSCGKQEGTQESKVEEFVEGKVYAPGEFFKIGKKTYKTLIDTESDCGDCDLVDLATCGLMLCTSASKNPEGVQYILYDEDTSE